jgi:uncharacterized membrane protein YczE
MLRAWLAGVGLWLVLVVVVDPGAFSPRWVLLLLGCGFLAAALAVALEEKS